MKSAKNFEPHLTRWDLVPDGEPIFTPGSQLLPVRRRGEPAMLKVAHEQEERWGALLMRWWDGDGAARVLAHDGDALLLERAAGTRSLAEMARDGRDDEASRIICEVAARLHAPRDAPPPELIGLPHWFRELWPAAERHGGLLARAAVVARKLLDAQREIVPLHGDIHHENVFDFGPRGWLAIDPKRLAGERTFDYVNMLRNPDFAMATAPGRLARQATVIAEAAGLDRTRLLQWTLAFAALSAAWIMNDGDEPTLDIAVAEIAEAELAKSR
jgi:streptomycin 6-kinase